MIVGSVLVVLFALFLFVKKHAGPALLAIIAGLSVYALFGPWFVETIVHFFPNASAVITEQALYFALVAVFPLLLYFRSGRGGMGGLLRLIQAAVFAIILTALMSDLLASFFAFDVIARDIANFIADIQGIVVLVGVIFAYVDILFYRNLSSGKE